MTDRRTNGPVLFHRRMFLIWWVWLAAALPLVIFVVVIVGGITENNTTYSIWFGALALALLALLINFGSLVFEVTEEEVVARFGVFAWRYPRSKVLSCEPYTLTFRNYLGYGIRFGVDGTKALNTRNGPGIVMHIEGEKRPLVVSVDDPDEVCRLLGLPEAPPSVEEDS
ncbi:MAG: hypothetical protein KKF41_00770 [Actinobacteria bacterium]|nr:hypothetical protein [Actinomycetota bacterium]MBU1942777.1 hypothetical protein [Actinomycetota bacterium]MBU2686099.1 hypothetical protein [Actinomycetota bacterium]